MNDIDFTQNINCIEIITQKVILRKIFLLFKKQNAFLCFMFLQTGDSTFNTVVFTTNTEVILAKLNHKNTMISSVCLNINCMYILRPGKMF